MNEPMVVDVSFLLLLALLFVWILWKVYMRSVQNETNIVGVKDAVDDIRDNHLKHIWDSQKTQDKRLQFLTGVVIAHFPPHSEELKRQMRELEDID